MTTDQLYQQRLNRYVTAMRNEKPDKIPIRPFVAEFTAKYAGMTCQQVAHDYTLAFEAAVKCAKDFDWDAMVVNMVWVWTGLAQAAGGFQAVEPGHLAIHEDAVEGALGKGVDRLAPVGRHRSDQPALVQERAELMVGRNIRGIARDGLAQQLLQLHVVQLVA